MGWKRRTSGSATRSCEGRNRSCTSRLHCRGGLLLKAARYRACASRTAPISFIAGGTGAHRAPLQQVRYRKSIRPAGPAPPFSIITFIPTMWSAPGITRIWRKACATGAGTWRCGHRIEPAATSPSATRLVKSGAVFKFTGSENHASGPDHRSDEFSVSYG